MATPIPKENQLLVHVHAAGITGDEILWPEVYDTPSRIPGHEFSGVISAFGPEYEGPLEIGQDVYAAIGADPGRGEGQAEYAICYPHEVALKPASISHQEAAALPIPLLTAWEALIDQGKAKPGSRVLITGASGAVGRISVSLATELGIHVVALASSKNFDLLKSLGAKEVIDYHNSKWGLGVKDIDLVFDTVGGQVLSKCWDIVKPDGIIVTVADPAPPWAFGGPQPSEFVHHPRVQYKYFIFIPNAERLSRAASLIDSSVLVPLGVEVYPFEQAERAWVHAQERNRGKKVVVKFVDIN